MSLQTDWLETELEELTPEGSERLSLESMAKAGQLTPTARDTQSATTQTNATPPLDRMVRWGHPDGRMLPTPMERARWDAWKSVILQALAAEARNGRQAWAKGVLKRADEAMLKVKPEDLVRVHLNKA